MMADEGNTTDIEQMANTNITNSIKILGVLNDTSSKLVAHAYGWNLWGYGATVGLVTMDTEDMEDTTLGRVDGADGTFTGPFLTGLKRGEFRENLCISGIFDSYQILPCPKSVEPQHQW